MISIKEARNNYNKVKSNGAIVGMNAFIHHNTKDLLILARKLANQSNRQYKRMLSQNYKTPAIIGYYRANTGKRSDSRMNPTEMYDTGKISVNKNMDKSQLLDIISHSLYFMNAKTHTISGYNNVLEKAKETLKKTSNIDLTSLTKQQTNEFWNRYNELLDEGKQFAAQANSMGSPKVLEMINKYKEENGLDSLLESMNNLSNDMEDGTYDDFYNESDTDNDEGHTEGIWFS